MSRELAPGNRPSPKDDNHDLASLRLSSAPVDEALRILEELSDFSPQLHRRVEALYHRSSNAELLKSQSIVSELMRSLSCDDAALYFLRVPAGVSDLRALQALNQYAQARFGQPVVFPADLAWYAEEGGALPASSEGREISIYPVIEDTTNMSRYDQGRFLRAQNLTFAFAVDVALIAATFACRTGGADLLTDRYVATAHSSAALTTIQNRGLFVSRADHDEFHYLGVCAAGAPRLNVSSVTES